MRLPRHLLGPSTSPSADIYHAHLERYGKPSFLDAQRFLNAEDEIEIPGSFRFWQQEKKDDSAGSKSSYSSHQYLEAPLIESTVKKWEPFNIEAAYRTHQILLDALDREPYMRLDALLTHE